MLAHFFPDVSARFRPALPARTGFYQEPVAAVQLVCAADAGWPGAGGPGPQVTLFNREAPLGAARGGDGEHGDEQRSAAQCEPRAASAAGAGRG
ncbi:hypothetical protein AM629_20175 [Photorhabdus heterorhabditis]|uniref:Uncharacterized protein n=1 Tax=Photorhabdus heterorhabditis TaxID=880156 RepID=A0ABR5K6P7_9GAMM|nr:hypothetical protein AM629_20175 [Photorhabdus heterorhabditis]